MQTPAEKHLIAKITELLRAFGPDQLPVRLLNVGAGQSVVVEEGIQAGWDGHFVCDRADVIDCRVSHAAAGQCFRAGAEEMPAIASGYYDIVFANYVLEHVADPGRAAAEIARVLKPGGYFIASLANPTAPEFIISKYTPTWFHQTIKGKGEGSQAHETCYAYQSIKGLSAVFGPYFIRTEAEYWPNTFAYLHRFRFLSALSRAYDCIVGRIGIKALMGNVCLTFRKKSCRKTENLLA